MNKVYFAIVDDDYGGAYIAAPNIKEAKVFARGCEVIYDHMESFIDLKIHLCRENGKPIYTKYCGELDVKQIIDVGCAWFGCDNPDCGDTKNIEIVDGEESTHGFDVYRCKTCGYKADVPYVGL